MWGRFAAFVVLAALLAGCGADDGTVAPTATTTSTLPDPSLVWARVSHDEAVFGGPADQVMKAVTAGGPGLVAAGHDLSGELDAVVWVSADGYTWTRIDAPVFGGPTQQGINSVTAGGPGLVAVGHDGWCEAVWVSTDGYTWTSAEIDPYAGVDVPIHVNYQQAMRAVTAGGPGLVAAGYADRGATAWWTSDGLDWRRDIAFWINNNGAMDEELNSVAAGGPGLVAGGEFPEIPSNNGDAVIWVSADGHRWTRIDDEAVFGGEGNQAINAVTAGGPGLVAVGYSFSAEYRGGVVWVSADGYSWSRVFGESLVGGTLSSVAATESGLVAVGWDWVGEDTDAAVWVSADGYTWTRTPHDEEVFGGPGRQSMISVTAGGPGVVAVGEDWSGGDGDAAVWVATPSLP